MLGLRKHRKTTPDTGTRIVGDGRGSDDPAVRVAADRAAAERQERALARSGHGDDGGDAPSPGGRPAETTTAFASSGGAAPSTAGAAPGGTAGASAGASAEKARTAPHPDDPSKPDSPTDLSKPSWGYVLKKALREFSTDQCTDLAAALTYYAVLALFPALIALVSLLGVVGQGRATTDALLQVLTNLGQQDVAETIEPVVSELVNSPAAGLGLVTGLLGALWSASGFVGAFSRAMNRVYEIDEGRPFWKLRPAMILVTLVSVLLIAVALLILVLSGGVAEEVGNLIGLGSTAVMVWGVVKWPVLAGIVVLVVAILYYATPNVKQPKFRWMSVGALIAIVVWLLASVGLGFYVSNFGSYDATYGALAGVIVFLLWLWITNLALLFGAEFDAEIERGRELQAGIAAEETIQLPPRDTRASDKAAAKEAEDVARARQLRESRGATSDTDEDPAAARRNRS